ALARAGAPQPDRARRPLDAARPAAAAARGVRPLRAALHRLGRGAAAPGDDRGARPAAPPRRAARGLRADRVGRARPDEPTGACAVGRPDELHGEEVVAFVTVAGEPDEDELLAFGKERLGGYKYPRELHIVPSLPLTPVGKVDRKALRELLPTRGGTC